MAAWPWYLGQPGKSCISFGVISVCPAFQRVARIGFSLKASNDHALAIPEVYCSDVLKDSPPISRQSCATIDAVPVTPDGGDSLGSMVSGIGRPSRPRSGVPWLDQHFGFRAEVFAPPWRRAIRYQIRVIKAETHDVPTLFGSATRGQNRAFNSPRSPNW
jgi:hypothetical protein